MGMSLATACTEPESSTAVLASSNQPRLFQPSVSLQAKNYYARGQDGSGWTQADANEAAAAAATAPSSRTRHDSPDASPPRRRAAARHDSPDASPPRRPT
eukprot:scaffold298284_cov18-Tisochrysis_lutea.AAC.2